MIALCKGCLGQSMQYTIALLLVLFLPPKPLNVPLALISETRFNMPDISPVSQLLLKCFQAVEEYCT